MQDLDNNKVRILPISIIIFIVLAIIAVSIILRKGRIGNYSFVIIHHLPQNNLMLINY